MRLRRILAAAIVSCAAAACATPQTSYLERNPEVVPRQGSVPDPVFFAQKTRECGPASLAMVLSQTGVRVRPEDLVADVYNPGREGTLTPALVAAARRHGRVAYPVRDLVTALRAVHQGRPVLVLQNLALQWYPQWHYAVIVGYDLDRGTVTLHSGVTQFLEMPLATFEHTWKRGGYWGLLALRPGEFPDPVAEDVYVSAVAGVERAGRLASAAQAYWAAARRWPTNLVAGMGLGNALYKMGELRAAAKAYRAVIRSNPKAADAFNNLAHVLGELGELDAAERAARTAVALGGANIAAYQQTLRTVLAARTASTAVSY